MKRVHLLFSVMLLTLLQACDGSDDPAMTDVNADPDAPVLASIGNKFVTDNQQLNFTVSATDANGDQITYTTQTITGIPNPLLSPSPATFASGNFNWDTPPAGVYRLKFIATDDSAMTNQDSETVTFAVFNSTPITESASQTLYVARCGSCHAADGSGGSSGVPVVGIAPADVNSSIANVGAMSGISVSADEEIGISGFLNTIAPN